MNKKLSSILLIICVLVIIGVIFGFKLTGNAVKDSPGVVKVGVILPLTGSQANYGLGVKEGLELALKEINSKENKIELIYEDSASDVKNSVSAAHKLIDIDKVPILITSVSQHAVAVAPVAQEKKTVQFAIVAQTRDLINAGDYVFMSDSTLDLVGKGLAELIYRKGYRKTGVIFATYNDAAVDAKNEFLVRFRELGGEAFSEGFRKDESDFRTYLGKLKSNNIDSVLIDGLQGDNGLIIKQIKELGMEQQSFGIGSIEDPKVIEASGKASEGIIFVTFQGFPSEKFIKMNEDAYSHYPLRWAAEAYDGLNIIAKAINNVNGDMNSENIKNELSKIKEYDGETGHIKFDDLGNAIKPIYTKQVKDGKFVKYEG